VSARQKKLSLQTVLFLQLFGVLSPTFPVFGQTDSDIVPNRYLIVYRNGVLPADVETRINSTGARLFSRNDYLGIAIIQTIQSPNSALERISNQRGTAETTAASRLAAQPDIEYVLHDRIVTAHHLNVRPVPVKPIFKVAVAPSEPRQPH